MSHKATNWLSGIAATDLSNSEFRVLFYLCDCHNPAQGCFPTQKYLIESCGVSNGTVNNALNSLEAKGLIARHRAWDERTHRQKPTRYTLGFELDKPQKPTPETGDGNFGSETTKSSGATARSRLQAAGGGRRRKPSPASGDGKRTKPTPVSGDGTVSNSKGKPTPISGGSRLQPTGEVTCKEPVINPEHAPKPSENPMVCKLAEDAVRSFRGGRKDAFADLPGYALSHIIAADLLTPQERQQAGHF